MRNNSDIAIVQFLGYDYSETIIQFAAGICQFVFS